MGIYGYIWVYMDMYGYVWVCMDTNEKIAIFCILASLLILNFTVLFYMWRKLTTINTSIELLAERIQDIKIENEPKPSNSNRLYPTAPFQTSQH